MLSHQAVAQEWRTFGRHPEAWNSKVFPASDLPTRMSRSAKTGEICVNVLVRKGRKGNNNNKDSNNDSRLENNRFFLEDATKTFRFGHGAYVRPTETLSMWRQGEDFYLLSDDNVRTPIQSESAISCKFLSLYCTTNKGIIGGACVSPHSHSTFDPKQIRQMFNIFDSFAVQSEGIHRLLNWLGFQLYFAIV